MSLFKGLNHFVTVITLHINMKERPFKRPAKVRPEHL